ncbi:hypothetical protein MNEG_11550, partial [Monoraphidium neglectum]
SIREISAAVAVAVIRAAASDGHLHSEEAREALAEGGAELLSWVTKSMYSPQEYGSLTYRPPGIGE